MRSLLTGYMAGLVALSIACTAGASTVMGGKTVVRGNLASLVHTYWSDLNAHQYTKAARLQATCTATIQVPSQLATTGRRLILRGAPDARLSGRALRFVGAAHIENIKRVASVYSRRYQLVEFHVSGTYTFHYPSAWAGNDERTSGYHRIVMVVRSCGGRWGIESSWWQEGASPFAWR